MKSMPLASHRRGTARLALAAFTLALGLSSCGRADRITGPTSGIGRDGTLPNAPKATGTAPAAPTLSSPLNGATGVAQSPTLAWNASTGATAYDVQVATSTRFTGLVVNSKNVAATSLAVNGLLPNTLYYWHVAAKSAGGTSAYSATCSFTTAAAPTVTVPATPVLVAPANHAAGVSANPTLSWNAATGATSYRVQVSSSSTFATLAVDSPGLTGTSLVVTGLTAGTAYFWRVSAANSAGASAFSAPFDFTVASAVVVTAPAAPVLVSPANHSIGVDPNAILSWGAVTGATSYRLQVSNSSTFATLLVDNPGLTGTSLAMAGLTANAVFYWRVCAANSAGEGAFSAVFDFTVAGVPPVAPVLVSPANLATGVAANPTLSWAASTGATSYNLQVSTSATFATTVVNAIGVAGTSQALSGLQTNTTYYWRVSASNAIGTSAWSQTSLFTTLPPDPCASLTGLGGTVLKQSSGFVSFRVGRLRYEATGDVASGAIQTSALCTASATPAVTYIGGTANVTLAGTNTSVVGGPLSFPTLLWGGLAEPGVIIVNDAAGNVLEIVWPSLDPTLPPGPPILRLQLASYNAAAVVQGVALDVHFTYQAQAPDGSIATFTVDAPATVVPALR